MKLISKNIIKNYIHIFLIWILVGMLFTTNVFAEQIVLDEDLKISGSNDIIEEIPVDPSDYPHKCGDEQDPSSKHISLQPHDHFIDQMSRVEYNGFIPLTQYLENSYATTNLPTLSYTKGRSFQISQSINIGGNFELSAVIKGLTTKFGASISKNLGSSYTVTASTTYTFPIPYKTRGRIVYRYKQDMYYFTKYTMWYFSGDLHNDGEGFINGKYYENSSYYALQKIYI